MRILPPHKRRYAQSHQDQAAESARVPAKINKTAVMGHPLNFGFICHMDRHLQNGYALPFRLDQNFHFKLEAPRMDVKMQNLRQRVQSESTLRIPDVRTS